MATGFQRCCKRGTDRRRFEEVEGELRAIFSHISYLGFDPFGPGVRLAFATDRSPVQIAAPLESDGVLLATFLCWRLHGTTNKRLCVPPPRGRQKKGRPKATTRMKNKSNVLCT